MSKKIFIGGILAFSLLVGGIAPSFGHAQTTDENLVQQLQEQIQQLLAQVQQLQSQIQNLQETQVGLQEEIQQLRLEARQLRIGVRGDDVELLQEFLASDPDIYPEGLVTGYFGPLTEKAVKKFQKKFDIEQVGEVGPQTRERINSFFAEGAGKSGKVPPGHLIAPGFLKNFGPIDFPEGQKLPYGIAKKFGFQKDKDKDDDDEDDEDEDEDEDDEDDDDTQQDTTNPEVSTLSPADNATDVEVETNLVITFSEVVDAESGDIVVKKASDDTVFETVAVGSTTGTGTNTITVDLTGTLAFSTEYYVQIDATAFDDTAGNSYAGIADNSTWNFTTKAAPDTEAPTISTLSPADNATDVAVDANLVITFSEVVETGNGNLTVQKASDDSVVETLAAAAATGSGTDTVTFDLVSNLDNSTEYYVLMDTGLFKDSSMNETDSMSEKSAWNFTTIAP